MQNILARWQFLPREDLFAYWQEELTLKKELRSQADAYQDIKLGSEAEFEFARLSLAYGEARPYFFSLLFFNMNHQPIQFALVNGPEDLYHGFLQAVPGIISRENPSPRALQFLINLYREELQAYFAAIVQVLNKPACDYLLERTASKSLRQLLSLRQQAFNLTKDENESAALESSLEFQGLFADRIPNILASVRSSLNLSNRNNSAQTVESLQAAELLFMIGQLKDCLSFLTGLHQQMNSESSLYNHPQALKHMQRLVNKVLPVYFLLHHPMQAAQRCLQCFQQDFQGISADESLQLYLELHSCLLVNYHGNPAYTLLEITAGSHNKEDIPGHRLPAWLRRVQQGDADEEALAEISRCAHEIMPLLPHESFVVMEFIRWLTNTKRIDPNQEIKAQLLRDYIRLYHWIPSPLFMNREIYSQLVNPADRNSKQEADRILELQAQYSLAELHHNYKEKANTLLNDPVFKHLLTGFNMGV